MFERLKPDQLEQASVALYYAVVLQATSQGESAKNCLDISAGLKLLPEERKLLIQARANAEERRGRPPLVRLCTGRKEHLPAKKKPTRNGRLFQFVGCLIPAL